MFHSALAPHLRCSALKIMPIDPKLFLAYRRIAVSVQFVDKRGIVRNAEARRCGVRRGVARFSANSTSSVLHLNGGRRSPTNRPLTRPIEAAETVRHVSLRVGAASPLLRVEDYAHRPKAFSGLPTDCGFGRLRSLLWAANLVQPAFSPPSAGLPLTSRCRQIAIITA